MKYIKTILPFLSLIPALSHAELTLSVHSYYEGEEIFQAESPISVSQDTPTILSEAIGSDHLEANVVAVYDNDDSLVLSLDMQVTNSIDLGDTTSIYSPSVRLVDVTVSRVPTCFENLYFSYESKNNGELSGVYSVDVCVTES
ncbi:hypothetical protein [Vibrio agarivorans]|uniref:DUF3244 domain-containing protein n=1 Tax=Vibrio agarivorans TaxID=153622 RepID=A0ABT7Y784_9VIBR|nr:hypothetical protein [Vibrio agarivorans]MDN2483906.1 hypothetical protein [Vibrio agarivorans]